MNVNDLEDDISSKVLTFAGDTKVFGKFERYGDEQLRMSTAHTHDVTF